MADLAGRVLETEPRLGEVRLVCIDGPAGSGKSTLAGRLAKAANDAFVVHLDDLYEGWHGLGKVWDRLEEWVLAPLRDGLPARYRRYDWENNVYAEWHDVPVGKDRVLVIEGVGSADLPIDRDAVLKIWVEAPLDLRYERGIERDGEGFRPYWEMWAAQEVEHFAKHQTRERADLLVVGNPELPHDPETELVVRSADDFSVRPSAGETPTE